MSIGAEANPDDAIVEEKFLAATGPGGQNVNKVATAVQLRINAFRLGLPPYAWAQLKILAGSRLTAEGATLRRAAASVTEPVCTTSRK